MEIGIIGPTGISFLQREHVLFGVVSSELWRAGRTPRLDDWTDHGRGAGCLLFLLSNGFITRREAFTDIYYQSVL